MKDVLSTIGTRYLIAILNLGLIFINSKVLGVAGVGLMGLILAATNIVGVFCGILAGNTIVYFMNRYVLRPIFFSAYCWTFVGAAVACGVMFGMGLLPEGYEVEVYGLAVLTTGVTVNSRILLGKNQITAFNVVFALQGGLLFFVLLFFYYGLRIQEVNAYVVSLYITNGIAFLVSLGLILPYLRQKESNVSNRKPYGVFLKEMFIYGLWGSADNVAEVCTTRLNYFLIKRCVGLRGVGLLDDGTKVSESVWHINRSIGFIEYSRVARTNDVNEQKQLTLRFFKLTFGAVTLAICGILLLPEWIYTDYLFSAEFVGMRKVIVGLSVGIVALACNSILSQYFVGTRRVRWSAGCSFLGLFRLLISGYWLMPLYGVVVAAVSCSIAYCSMLTFSLIVFCRVSGTHWTEFRITKSDIRFALSKIRKQT